MAVESIRSEQVPPDLAGADEADQRRAHPELPRQGCLALALGRTLVADPQWVEKLARDEPIRVGNRQLLQERRVEDGEDGRVRGDSDRQREHDRDRGPRAARRQTHARPQIRAEAISIRTVAKTSSVVENDR